MSKLKKNKNKNKKKTVEDSEEDLSVESFDGILRRFRGHLVQDERVAFKSGVY